MSNDQAKRLLGDYAVFSGGGLESDRTTKQSAMFSSSTIRSQPRMSTMEGDYSITDFSFGDPTFMNYIDTQCDNDVLGQLSPGRNISFTINYIQYPPLFYKIQRRPNKQSTQRIENGNISFCLDFNTVENREAIKDIYIKVKRTKESDNPLKQVGEVPLQYFIELVQATKMLIKLNLDSVYEYKGKKVYELERSSVEELNMFHLIVEVHFSSGNNSTDIVTQNTKQFQLIGKKKEITPAGSKRARPHSDSTTSNSSIESLLTGDSSGVDSPLSAIPYTTDDIGVIKARKVVADHIKTKTIEIADIFVGKTIQTSNGDIAYHFKLEDKDAQFEEGEIVGFVPDEFNSGNIVLVKLNFKNASEAILKGVITRSQYLEAQKPMNGEITETVCMMGIVPVQVKGSVCTNEALYASPHHPGLAISGYHLDADMQKDAAFIGYAFSSYKPDDETSIGFVQAGVSVLQSAGQTLLNEKLRNMEDNVEQSFKGIKKSRTKWRRGVILCGVLTFVFLILLAAFLWQLFVPGSAYHYYICKLGRKVPHGKSFYNFIPLNSHYTYPRVNGIEFTFEELMKRNHKNYNRLNLTGVRYYRNIDRCAYGKLSKTADQALNSKPVYGPTVFAVDMKCYDAYYYDEVTSAWRKYNSVSWVKFNNLFCEPRSKWKDM